MARRVAAAANDETIDPVDASTGKPWNDPGGDDDRREAIDAVMLSDPASIRAEAIRSLRTRIIAQHVREGRRALALCTPSVDSGCTFTAINLAVAMAQIGVKTVLVDADLRSPGVGRQMGLSPDRLGLSDYLADRAVHSMDILGRDVIPHLSVIDAGQPLANPQELLSAERFRSLSDQLLREFDLTIFDTTPANTCTDAQRVATVARYSLIVARKHKTYLGDVTLLAKQLRADGSVIVGTVLSDF